MTRHFVFAFAALASATLYGAAIDQKDVEFARPGGKPLLLDLHVPDGPGPFPAAILVHGGGFDEGSRATNMKPTFEPLTNAGIAWFSIDYRMAPEFRFPQAKEDIQSAIRWVKEHASQYRVNPNKVILAGESAGGYLVNYAGTQQSADRDLAAVVDIYGAVDYAKLAVERRDHPERFNMNSINRHMNNGGGIAFFGATGADPESLKKLRSISPIFAVHKGMPPFLCIHGDKDDQVAYNQTPLMCDAMKKVGATCDIITVEGGGHGMGSWKAPEQQHWKTEMIAWLRKTLDIK